MSKTRKNAKGGGGRERHISVRATRRNPPDYRKLSKALIQLAIAEAEAQAEAETNQQDPADNHRPDEARP